MRGQKKKQEGITLIALVISIIIMLILAGVSLNAMVGENGILTQAQEATRQHKIASELEALQMAVVNHSAKAFTNEEESLDALVNDLFAQELIDWVDGQRDGSGNIIDYNQYEDENNHKYVWVKKGDNSYRIFLNEDETYLADRMPLVGGGTLLGGTYVVTQNAFSSGEGVVDQNEKGKFTIDGDTKVIFNEPLGVQSDGITASGEMLSIYVKSGANVKIYFNANDEKKASDGKTYYKLTNSGLSRSAIDIEPGGNLEIVIAENTIVSVDSGVATSGTTGTNGVFQRSEGGAGGYAGIHVPVNAELNLYGNGTLYAYGGRASNGGSGVSDNATVQSHQGNGGGGGGGAGAGIGGNGGKGGAGNSTCNAGGDWTTYLQSYTDSGLDGENGESCGNVNIHNSLTVYSYGGGGGASPKSLNFGTSTGGGGYPAAGIGGGGAGAGGGDWGTGAGGYTSSTGDNQTMLYETHNGITAQWDSGGITCEGGTGASYYTEGYGATGGGSRKSIIPQAGGQGGLDYGWFVGGSGGVAGKGGEIKVSRTSTIYAFNGDRITEESHTATNANYDASSVLSNENGEFIEAKIYAQDGILRAVYCITAKWGQKPNHNYSYFYGLFGNTCEISDDFVNPTSHDSNYKNVCVRKDTNITPLTYKNNITGNAQGIGSGAGYIELSNGSYTKYNEDSSSNFTTVYTGE